LLATHNGESYIYDQCESFIKQLYSNLTVVVSDDSSSDNTLKIISKLLISLNILPKTRQGSAAQNFFRLLRDADFSNCDYVALADQDDVWLPTKLSRAVQQIKLSHAEVYSSNVTAFWPNGKQKLINKAQSQRESDFMFESAGPGCTFVLSQKLALAIQAFLIANQEKCKNVALHDWFIYAFARSREFKWVIDHESHMLYRQHASNVVGANVGFKAKWQRFKKLREGWLFSQAILIADILGYATEKPIQKIKHLSFKDRVWLILNARNLRRRLRDQLALAFFVLFYTKK
jgi:rhamnosyltransferase